MGKFVEVTREQFLEFVKNYQGKLEFSVNHTFEPPMGAYNDFSDGKKWPHSVVAYECQNWLSSDGLRSEDNSRPGKYWTYHIAKEV